MIIKLDIGLEISLLQDKSNQKVHMRMRIEARDVNDGRIKVSFQTALLGALSKFTVK